MAEKTLKFVLLGEDKASGVVKAVEGTIADLDRQVKKSTREVSLWRRGIEGVRAGMHRLTSTVFSLKGALLGLGLGYIAKQTIEVANSFEQYRMTLQVLEKGIDAGNKKFQELLVFATQTPYRINEVMEAYKTLKAYGLDPTIETMTALGDTAAAMGKEVLPRLAYAFGQMAATGKVMAQDLMQLSNAGVNVGDALKSGFNIGRAELEKLNEAIAAGVVDMQDVIDVFMGYMRDQFGGMMQRQMSTLGGQIEELRSYWQLFQDTLMKQGTYNEVTAFLTALNDRIQELQEEGKLDEWALRVGEAIVGAMEASAKAIGVTIDSVRILKDSLTVIVKTMALFFALISRDKDVIKEATEDLKNYVKEIGKRKSAYEEIKKELEGLEGKMEEVKLDARIRETASSIVADIRGIRKETKGLVADLSGVGETGKEELGELEKAAEAVVEDIRGVYGEMEKQAEAVWKATRTPLERYQEEVKKLNKLLEAGMISQETYVRGITSAWERYGGKVREVNEEIKKSGGEVEEVYLSVWYEIRQNIADFLDQAMQGFASFRDFANSVWAAIRRSLSSALAEMITDWLKSMHSMAGGARGLLGTLGTAVYGIAGMVRGEPWRAVGGVGAAAAMFTGHPMIATAIIASAEIARAIFKGRVEWVGVGAGAVGIPATRIGLEKPSWMEKYMFFGWPGALFGFGRTWPTIRGTAELSLKGLSDSLDYVEGYMREIEKYLDEHTEIYAMYKTRFARVTVIEKRDVKGGMDEITQAFGSFVDDLIDFYQNILPSTMRFEELPSIEMTFGAGKKNMENLAKQFVNELVSQTYNAWTVPIVEEYNRLLGVNLFEKFGLPKIGELVGGIGHRWNEQMKKLYERLSREVLPSLGVAFTYAKTIMDLMDKYGEGLVSVYKDEIANELVNMLEKYKGEVQGLKEEEVKKKAEEFGQTVNKYLSTVVDFISDVEDIIAKYTLSEPAYEFRKLDLWYRDMVAQADMLGLSIDRVNEALAATFWGPISKWLDTRSDYEKAVADVNDWYDAAVRFVYAHQEVVQQLGLDIDWVIRQLGVAKRRMLAGIEESKPEEEIRQQIEDQRRLFEERREQIEKETRFVIDTYRERLSELENIRREWKRVNESAIQAVKQLRFGGPSPLTPAQAWPQIRAEYEKLKAGALTSPEAAQAFLDFYTTYLDYANKMFKSSQTYIDIWQDVLSVLGEITNFSNQQISEIEMQAGVLKGAIQNAEDTLAARLESINNSLQAISETNNRLDQIVDLLMPEKPEEKPEPRREDGVPLNVPQREWWLQTPASLRQEIWAEVGRLSGLGRTISQIEQSLRQAGYRWGAIEATAAEHGWYQTPLSREWHYLPQGLQEGGLVNRPLITTIAEAGPEAVIPLSKGAIRAEIDYDKLAKALAKQLNRRPIEVIIDAPIKLDGKEIKRWLHKSRQAREFVI